MIVGGRPRRPAYPRGRASSAEVLSPLVDGSRFNVTSRSGRYVNLMTDAWLYVDPDASVLVVESWAQALDDERTERPSALGPVVG